MGFVREISKAEKDVWNTIKFYSNPQRAYFLLLAIISLIGSMFDRSILQFAILPMLNFMFLVVVATGLIVAGQCYSAAQDKGGAKKPAGLPALAFLLSAVLLVFLFSMLDAGTRADLVSPLGIIIFIISFAQMLNLSEAGKLMPSGAQQDESKSGEKIGENRITKIGVRLAIFSIPGIMFGLFILYSLSRNSHQDITEKAGIALFLSYLFYSLICVQMDALPGAGAATKMERKKAKA